MIQRLKDYLHEFRIHAAFLRVTRNPTRHNSETFRRLILDRSPQQVARMERRMGIGI